MDIMRICAIGLIGAILALSLKNHAPAFALLAGLACSAVIVLMLLGALGEVISLIRDLSDIVHLPRAYFEIVLKILGIAYISQITAQLCSDAGEGGLSEKISMGGKILIAVNSMPIMLGLVEMTISLLK